MKVLGAAVAAEAGKKTVEHAVDRAKQAAKSKRGRAALKKAASAAKPAAVAVARVVPVVGGAAAVTYAGGKALTANRQREAKRWADAQLKATRKKLPKLTSEQARTLWDQYYQHALKKPVTNSYSGK